MPDPDVPALLIPGHSYMKSTVIAVSATLLACSFPALGNEADRGKQVFTQEAQPSCTVCHTLSDAGSSGTIGPNLDEMQPSREQVINAVTGGVGIMPAFNESLSPEQIQAVADYIAEVTGATQ